MASLEYRPDEANWESIYVGYRANGKNNADGPYTTVLSAAKAKRAIEEKIPPRRRRSRVLDGVRPVKTMTWEEILLEWEAGRRGDAEHPITDESIAEYKAIALKTALALGWDTIRKATKRSVIEHRAKTNGVGCTSAFRYLRHIYRWAGENLGQPYDLTVYRALRPPQSGESDVDLIEDRFITEILENAKVRGQFPLFHCLTQHGWRPASACRVQVKDVNLEALKVTVLVKRNGRHPAPITRETAAILKPLIEDREPDEHVFLSCNTGLPWKLKKGAVELDNWYKNNLRPKDAGNVGDIYALKRWAICTMFDLGVPPAEIALITGHKCIAQVLKYFKHNEKRARSAVEKMGAHAEKLQSTECSQSTAESTASETQGNGRKAEILHFPSKASG